MTIDVGDCDATAVRMMRLNGLSVRRISLALNVSEYRVKKILSESGGMATSPPKKRFDDDDELPPAA